MWWKNSREIGVWEVVVLTFDNGSELFFPSTGSDKPIDKRQNVWSKVALRKSSMLRPSLVERLKSKLKSIRLENYPPFLRPTCCGEAEQLPMACGEDELRWSSSRRSNLWKFERSFFSLNKNKRYRLKSPRSSWSHLSYYRRKPSHSRFGFCSLQWLFWGMYSRADACQSTESYRTPRPLQYK